MGNGLNVVAGRFMFSPDGDDFEFANTSTFISYLAGLFDNPGVVFYDDYWINSNPCSTIYRKKRAHELEIEFFAQV